MESVSFRKSNYIARRVRFLNRSMIRPLLEVLCEYRTFINILLTARPVLCLHLGGDWEEFIAAEE